MKPLIVLYIVVMSVLAARHAVADDTPNTPNTASLANLDPAQIPVAERFPWQPQELVAVVGSHRFRHWGTVTGVAFSPNGGRIASGGTDGFIRLWDPAGRETAALQTPTHSVNCIAFSQAKRLLLAGGETGVIYAWKFGGAAPEELALLEPSPPPANANPVFPGHAIDAIEFSVDGKFLACSLGRQANVRIVLWDASSWPPHELPALPEATAPFAFAADSKTLYTQYGVGGIAAWDISGERPQKKTSSQLEGPRGQLLTMAITPNGKQLATCYADATAGAFSLDGKPRGDVVLWDLMASPPAPKAAFGQFKNDPMFFMLHAAAFSPDSNSFAFAAKDRHVELWNVAADPPQRQATLPGEISQAGSIAFSADGQKLAAAGPNAVRIWEVADGSAVPLGEAGNAPGVQSAAVSPSGRWLATSERLSRADEIATRLWDLSAKSPQQLAGTVSGMPVVFGKDGKLNTLEPVAQKPGVETISLRRFEISSEGALETNTSGSPAIDFFEVPGRMQPSGVLIAMGRGTEGKLALLGIGGGEAPTPYTLDVPVNWQEYRKYASADGSVVAANVGDYQNISVKVWKLAAELAKESWTVRPNPISPALPVNENTEMAHPGNDQVVKVESSEARPFFLWNVALAPGGEFVALADTEGTIQVWQRAGEKPSLQTSFIAHRQGNVMGAVQRITYSSDGRRLLTVGSDRKLSVWDPASGKALYTTSFPGIPLDACFTSDRQHVLTLNPDGTLYILRLPEKL